MYERMSVSSTEPADEVQIAEKSESTYTRASAIVTSFRKIRKRTNTCCDQLIMCDLLTAILLQGLTKQAQPLLAGRYSAFFLDQLRARSRSAQ